MKAILLDEGNEKDVLTVIFDLLYTRLWNFSPSHQLVPIEKEAFF